MRIAFGTKYFHEMTQMIASHFEHEWRLIVEVLISIFVFIAELDKMENKLNERNLIENGGYFG